GAARRSAGRLPRGGPADLCRTRGHRLPRRHAGAAGGADAAARDGRVAVRPGPAPGAGPLRRAAAGRRVRVRRLDARQPGSGRGIQGPARGRRSPRGRTGAAGNMSPTKGAVEVRVEDRTLRLTNLDKVLWPEVGFTKGQMIEYYTRIAPVLLPHLRKRPLTLKRYPDGIDGQMFYEKNCPKHRPPWMGTAKVWSGSNQRDMYYCVVDDL